MAEFEPLVDPQTEVFTEAVALLRFSAFGGDIDITTGAGWASFTLGVTAESSVGGRGAFTYSAFGGDLGGDGGGWGVLEYSGHGIATGIVPTTAYGGGAIELSVNALSQYERYNEADVGFTYSAFGGDLGGDGGGWGSIELSARGSEVIIEQNPGLLFLTPGHFYATIGYDSIITSDTLNLSSEASDSVTWSVYDVMQYASGAATFLSTVESVFDVVHLTDRSSLVAYLAAVSAVTFADAPEIAMYSLLAAATELQLSGVAEDALTSYAFAASTFVLAEQSAFTRQLFDEATSSLELDDAAIGNIQALTAALDTMTLADNAVGTMVALASVGDTLTLEDVIEGLLIGNLSAYDTINFIGQIRLLGIDYTAYSVSLDKQAVSEYENYNFGSFAVIDNEAFGLGDAGIYALEGVDDDGVPIVGRVRGPLSNLGTALKKSIPAVYVGYTSTRQLGLKVITTDAASGEKQVNIYSLSPIAKQATTDGRFTPAKGLHSVYWQFELISEDGGQFELDEVSMWRMVLNRRK